METDQKTQLQEKETKPQVNGYILLDTNIIICAGKAQEKNTDLRDQILAHIQLITSENEGWYLGISAITLYELIDQTSITSEAERERDLKGIKCFPITLPVIRTAARLSCFYAQQKVPMEKIQLPDKIIAGTAFQVGAVILTTNPSDYPAPFFAEITKYRKIIEFPGKSGYPAFNVLYVMVPQQTIINQFWEERKKPLKKMRKKKKR